MSYRYQEQQADYVRKIVKFFERKGWQEIDQEAPGYFTLALLMSADGNRVCKISDIWRDTGFSGDQGDPYHLYAIWVTTQNNPHFPKIYAARSLRKFGLFVTIMERLETVPFWVEDRADYELTESLRTARDLSLSARRRILDRDTFGGKLGEAVGRMIAKFGKPTDLHLGNVMLRNDGCVVITDPYARFAS